MILFLDFDGVLHPDPCSDPARLFENAPRLARVLTGFPALGVVLSSSWRTRYSLSALLEPLPEPLRQRVLGLTPHGGDLPAAVSRAPYRRQVECEHWLHCHGMAGGPWWALDDRPESFMPYCENLIECDRQRGFDDVVGARLHSILTLAGRRASQEIDLMIT